MTNWNKLILAMNPNARVDIVQMVATKADAVFPTYQIKGRRLDHMFAHMYVETGGFTTLEENLNYRAERLVEVWPKRFPNIAAAQPFARNPQALANKVYNGRMGNAVGSNDGWTYRGKGLLQCTGHDNTASLAKLFNITPEEAARRLLDPQFALAMACGVFNMLGVGAFADKDDIVGSTQAVNGGQIGLQDRKQALARFRAMFQKF